MCPLFCRASTMSSLFSGETRVDGQPLDKVLQLFDGEAGEVPSSQDAPILRTAVGDPEFGCDVPGGQGVVARDHHRADARRFGGLHGVPGLGPGRVDHADHAEEGKIALQLVFSAVERRQAPDAHPKNAETLLRQPLVCSRDPLSPSFVQGLGLPVGPDLA
jgi:hypothetical protein